MSSTIIAAVHDQSRRRMLLPIATMLTAVALAGVSGADFNDATTNSLSTYATGTFDLVNSRDGLVVFNTTNLKPGDTVTGSVTITNNSSMPALVSVAETDGLNTFSDPELLEMVIERDGTEIYRGDFGAWTGFFEQRWLEGDAHTYDFAVTLDLDATTLDQGKTAEVSYEWTSVQADAGNTYDGQTVPRANNG